MGILRHTCGEIYKHTKPHFLPDEIVSYGGSEDIFVDQFGLQIGVCSLREGFNNVQRDTYLYYVKQVDKNIPYIPVFTKQGFWKSKIPHHLFVDILEARSKALEDGKVFEEIPPAAGVINYQVVVENLQREQSKVLKLNRTLMIELKDEISEKIFKTLGPIAESWSGVKLKPTSVYGIRRYLNNSALMSHIDKPDTHIISVIINVAQV